MEVIALILLIIFGIFILPWIINFYYLKHFSSNFIVQIELRDDNQRYDELNQLLSKNKCMNYIISDNGSGKYILPKGTYHVYMTLWDGHDINRDVEDIAQKVSEDFCIITTRGSSKWVYLRTIAN